MNRSLLRLVAYAAVAFTACGTAVAQSLPTPAPMLEGLPSFDQDGGEDAPSVSEEIATPEESRPFRPLAPIPMEELNRVPDIEMAPLTTESSGTWLRRGLWYADTEAVVMNRTWNGNNLRVIQEYDAIQDVALLQVVQTVPVVVTAQAAEIGETSPGVEGMARLSIGRFLFRDQYNRDHTAEMSVFGGGEFNEQLSAEQQLTGTDGFFITDPNTGALIRNEQGLHVPRVIDNSDPLAVDTILSFSSFDRAETMDIDYSSRFHNWEWNYNVNQRMQKDRMELLPSGQWVRRASPGLTWSYLAGLRYFDLEEQLDWNATNIRSIQDPDTGASQVDGDYNVFTSNNLFGVQLGLGMTYETDRWNVTIHSRHGFYTNDARVTEQLTYTGIDDGTDDPSYNLDNHENSLSFVSQGGVTLRYHLRPNFSIRAGWEYLLATGVALAPNEASFNPAKAQIGATGDIFYQGVSIGTEYFW